jgi:hypothetical protein
MAEIIITTDGTINNTKLTVDGKEITKDSKVVSIDLYASAPFKGKYSGETYQGGVNVSFAMVAEDGKIERKSYGTTETAYAAGIGQKIKEEDQVIRYLGADVDAEITNLVDKIVTHCEKEKIPVAPKEKLLSRSIHSLKDKANDLGIKLEDAS